MIFVNKTEVKIEEKECNIAVELGMIFYNLIQNIGIKRTKLMIDTALDIVIEESGKQIKYKEELKEHMRRDLPNDLAEILCDLI